MKDLLQRAKYEIEQLRRANQLLSAQMEVVTVFAVALGIRPENRGQSIDVAWELQREIDRIDKESVA